MRNRDLVMLLKILRKTYEWRADRYKQDADAWRRNGRRELYAFYSGRAEESMAMTKEIDELILSMKVN